MSVRFSILIPAYNREQYIRAAIDSILSQSFTDYEIIVVDDGSTDHTLDILESYGSRIRLLHQQNCGPEVARNKGATIAGGEYLVLLDSDDLLLPGALAMYDRIIRQFDSPPLIIGSLLMFQDGEVLPLANCEQLPAEVLKFSNYFEKDRRVDLFTSMIVIRKSVFDAVGGFRNSTPQTFHLDGFNLILKCSTSSPCIFVWSPHTVAYRQHGTNTLRNLKAIADGILVLARTERQGGYPGGKEGRKGRYTFIGGIAAAWAIKYCLPVGEMRLVLKLLFGAAPMVRVAVGKKLWNRFRRPAQTIPLQQKREPEVVLQQI